MKKTIGVLLFALFAHSTAHAQATVAKCPNMIKSLDVPITTSGVWCLSKTLTGPGLVIDASNVTIEMRGFSIINSQVAQGGYSFGPSSQVGIKSEYDDNIRIRNGNIVGFDFGIRIGYPFAGRGTMSVENVFVRGSKQRGIDVVGCDEVTVVNNIVSDTVGPVAFGIAVSGQKRPASEGGGNVSVVTVEGNRVDNTRSEGTTSVPWRGSTALFVNEGGNTMVRDNIVTDVSTSDPGYDVTGIHVSGSHPYLVNIINNTILNRAAGTRSTGLLATQGGSPAYSGQLGTGLVSGTKIYGYYYGVFGQSDIWVDGVQTFIPTYTFTNNLVSGVDPIRAYLRGIMGKNNRIE